MKEKSLRKIFRIAGFILAIIILMLFILIALRRLLPVQLDDVNPLIECDLRLLEKSDTLMVIPIFMNKSIAENFEWCSYILSLNKTLGMHGVYHSYEEFYSIHDKEYILRGMEEFKKCFGFYPVVFEAPQVALSLENEKTLERIGFEVRGYPFQLMHKVYHCADTGKYSNRFIDIF